MAYQKSIDLIRDCLTSFNNGNIGYSVLERKHVTVKDLSDDEVRKVFAEYLHHIKHGQLAMQPQWRNIFLQTEQEVIEMLLLGDG